MKRLFISAFILIMVMEACTTIQQQTLNHIGWKMAATVPIPMGANQQPGIAGAFVGVTNNVLLVAGGSNFPDAMPWLGGKKKYYNDIYVFEKNTAGNISAYAKTFHLPYTIGYGASSSPGNGVVCAGGENENGLSNKVLLMQWDTINKQVIFKALPNLPIAVTNPAMTTVNNKLYLAGGENAEGVSDRFFVLDTKDVIAGWAELPRVPHPLSNAVMVAVNNDNQNNIYLIGGRKKNHDSVSTLYSSVYQYNTKNNEWQNKQPLPYALSAGTGLVTAANSIVLFGGDKGETFHKTEALIAAINSEIDTAKKQELINQKTELQQNHPGFSREILLYDCVADSWTVIGKLPFETQVTTTAVQFGNDFVIPGGEIRAGVRTPKVMVGKPSF